MSGDVAGANDEYAAALRLAPDDVGIVFNHARLLQREQRVAEARAEYARAAELARSQNRLDILPQIEAAAATLKPHR